MCIRDRHRISGQPKWELSKFSALKTTVKVRPVSYTHLDVYKRQKYLPCNETEVVGDDVDNNDNINYRIMTDYTGGDRTMTNHDRLNEFGDNNEHLNCICIYDVSVRYLILNNVYSFKVRLLFVDGG